MPLGSMNSERLKRLSKNKKMGDKTPREPHKVPKMIMGDTKSAGPRFGPTTLKISGKIERKNPGKRSVVGTIGSRAGTPSNKGGRRRLTPRSRTTGAR
jgi:hypothetical protein